MEFNRFLSDKSIIENSDFIIYGNDDLNVIKEKLIQELSNKKKEILDFFRLDCFPKTTINLFNEREIFLKFTRQFFEPQVYSYGNFINGMINFNYDKTHLGKNYEFLISHIIHEYVHLLYREIYKNKFERVVWLDEGLAQYLSDQFIGVQNNSDKFRGWFLDNIVRRDKEIPKIDYLKKHGSKYGEFVDKETNKYSGYAMSYLLVKYLFDNYNNVYDIISNKEKIEEIESTIIDKCIKYYDNYIVKDNIDEVNTPEELLDYMNKYIVYGWIDKDKNIHLNEMKGLRKNFILQSLEEVKERQIGSCIEQTLLEKYWFDKHNIENKIFCHRAYETDEKDDDDVKMHCFLIYKKDNEWYHFEHSGQQSRGIWKYDSLNDIYKTIDKRYSEEGKDRILSHFDYPKPGITFKEFNDFVNKFDNIEFKK